MVHCSCTCTHIAMHSLVLLWWWWSARLQHFLQEENPLPCHRLILRHGHVRQQRVVTNVTRIRVAVLIDGPLVLGEISVTAANILGLQVLDLRVNVELA
eukprot:EC799479.1.p1 GENE.EC799479.1~~EC799479.1.p1  ORF type:complete len:113 (-),score=29.17 EC799479.1:13-309(-)